MVNMNVSIEQPDPNQIGQAFVKQFYTVLFIKPNYLHRFYGTKSSYTHGDEYQEGVAAERYVGQVAIKKQIELENYINAKTIIKQVDACDCNGQVAVQVCGEISNNNEPLRRFMQTFVLAPQGDSSSKYYVLSDIFRYVDNIWPVEDSVVQEEPVEHEAPAAEPSVETPEAEAPAAPEEAESDVSQANSSPVEEAEEAAQPEEQAEVEQVAVEEEAVEEPVEAVTEEKPVEKEPEVATPPAAEEQKTEEAAVEEPTPVAEAPVVEAPPKPVAKPAVPSFTEIQESQQVACPAAKPVKKSWANLVANKTKPVFPTQPVAKVVPKPVQAPKKPTPEPVEPKPTTENNTQQRQNRPRQDYRNHNDDRQNYRNDGRTRNNTIIYADNQQVFIGNLRNNLSKDEIKEHFEKYGAVIEVRINFSPDGRQPNFGFVIFEDPETARAVLDNKPEARKVGNFDINIEEKKQRVQRRNDRGGGDFRRKYNNDRRDMRPNERNNGDANNRGGYMRRDRRQDRGGFRQSENDRPRR